MNSYMVKRKIGGAATFVFAGALMIAHGVVGWWKRPDDS